MKRNFFIILAALVLLSGCAAPGKLTSSPSAIPEKPSATAIVAAIPETPTETVPAATATSRVLTAEVVKNLEYRLNSSGVQKPVRLANGEYKSESGNERIYVKVLDPILLEDLNADNLMDAVALVSETSLAAPAPVNAYGRSKLEAEKVVLGVGGPAWGPSWCGRRWYTGLG